MDILVFFYLIIATIEILQGHKSRAHGEYRSNYQA